MCGLACIRFGPNGDVGHERVGVEDKPQPQELIIRPPSGWININFSELWEYRELLYFLTWRDIKVRYKQTVLGASWAVIQPFFTMMAFTLFFGNLAGIGSDGIPYYLFSYSALVPWTFFATGMAMSADSLIRDRNLIRKVYFPRLVIPIANVLGKVIDFVLAFLLLLVMMLIGGRLPTINVIFLPLFVLLAFITALAVGLWLSAMNVQFRDVRYAIPFLTQFWLFMTPIAYPSNLIENDTLRTLYGVNPMVGVVNGFRWALLDADTRPGATVMVSVVVAGLLLVSGLYYFTRMEKSFADVV